MRNCKNIYLDPVHTIQAPIISFFMSALVVAFTLAFSIYPQTIRTPAIHRLTQMPIRKYSSLKVYIGAKEERFIVFWIIFFWKYLWNFFIIFIFVLIIFLWNVFFYLKKKKKKKRRCELVLLCCFIIMIININFIIYYLLWLWVLIFIILLIYI